MGFLKPKSQQQTQVLPSATPVAQPVSSSANVRTAVKDRKSGADIRSDGVAVGGADPVTTVPAAGDISLGAKKKRKGVVGLDL
jgi:hypothetical protein